MKKEVMLFGLFFLLIVGVSFSAHALDYEQENINISAAYTCLEEHMATQGNRITAPEEILYLSLLFDDYRHLIDETISSEENCWPSGNCDLKTTSLYVLAKEGCEDISKPTEWLMDQRLTTTDLNWFLEIDGSEEMNCEVSYGTNSYPIIIQEDKKVTKNAGPCLVAENNYWYDISKSCYDETFEMTCDKNFITTLLFQEKDSLTYHVLKDSHHARDGETTTEKIESYCFGTNGECDYEGSLWAATLLKSLGEEVDIYLPYLIDGSDNPENEEYFPSVFLYFLTNDLDYRTTILEEFRGSYWDVSGDKYYDTGLAVWPFYDEFPEEKDLAKEWLLGEQDELGCWNSGNIVDTSWLLYTIWPDKSAEGKCEGNKEENKTCEIDSDCNDYYCEDWTMISETCLGNECVLLETCENKTICETDSDCAGEHVCNDGTMLYSECINNMCLFADDCDFGIVIPDDCVESGFTCTSRIDCSSLDMEWAFDDSCAGSTICCDSQIEPQNCVTDLGGVVCEYDEECSNYNTQRTSDLTSSQECCVTGTCEAKEDPYSCEDDEDCTGTDVCNSYGNCVDKNGGGGEGLTCEEVSGGICGVGSCDAGYKSSDRYECEFSGETCCIKDKPQPKWWIWLIFVLIVLVVLAIIFREKLKEAILKLKTKLSKGGKGKKPKGPRPRMMPPPSYPRVPIRKPLQRRVLPPSSKPSLRQPMIRKPVMPVQKKPTLPPKRPSSKSKEELDEVLKKLKDISK
jgi:hypothetical protein